MKAPKRKPAQKTGALERAATSYRKRRPERAAVEKRLPLSVPVTNPAPTSTVGVGGVVINDGYLQSNEKNRDMVGSRRYRVFSEMLANTLIVAAGVRQFLRMMAKSRWMVEPAKKGTSEAKKIAELVDDMRGDMRTPWRNIIRRAAMFQFYGFSTQEWTAKLRDDGVLGYLDVEARPQMTIERWDLDRASTVLGIVQTDPNSHRELYIPREKLVYIVDDSMNDSPEGLGLFRNAAEANRRLNVYIQLEGYGLESDLRGMPIARAPLKAMKDAGISDEQVSANTAALRSFIRNHNTSPSRGLLLDSFTYPTQDESARPTGIPQYDVQLLKGSITQEQAVAGAIQREIYGLAMLFGVESMLLGSKSVGSWGLAKDKTDTFAMLVDSALDEVREGMQRDWVRPIVELNGWDKTDTPVLKSEPLQHRDVESLARVLKLLKDAGASLMPNDPVVNTFRDLLGLPQADLEEALEHANKLLESKMQQAEELADGGDGGGAQEETDRSREEGGE